MTYIIYIIICLGVVVFQTTLSMSFSVLEGFYDLILLFIVYLGLFRSIRESLPFVICLGLIMDAISGGSFGLYLTSYFWLYVFIVWLIRFMPANNTLILPAIVVFGVVFENTIFLGTMALLDANARLPASSLQTVLVQVIWAVVTGPVLIYVFHRLNVRWEKWLKKFQPEYG
jgi:cell shape-determining protein MreD